ncbi:MAG: prefoldin subunit alpha [Candidatus Pacearchaeota archaeon]
MENELALRASLIQRQAEEINESISYISSQIIELEEFKNNLKFFDETKNTQMLSSLGKGVYAKTNLEDKKLIVSVGAGILVKKTPEEAQKTIDAQVKNLHEAKAHLMGQLEICNSSIRKIIAEIQSSKKEHNHTH